MSLSLTSTLEEFPKTETNPFGNDDYERVKTFNALIHVPSQSDGTSRLPLRWLRVVLYEHTETGACIIRPETHHKVIHLSEEEVNTVTVHGMPHISLGHKRFCLMGHLIQRYDAKLNAVVYSGMR